MGSRWGQWLESRVGHRQRWAERVSRPVHGGRRWAHTLGMALLGVLALEAFTGMGLAAYYAPTTTGAWASVNFIQNQVVLGWVMRGLHHFGATAAVLGVGAHLLQSLADGGYRAPREVNWLVGLLLLLLLLGAAHTGFLLPNDLRSYWATQVLLGIVGNQPGVGGSAQALIQGGPAFGNFTLTRLYMGHLLLLPVAMGVGTMFHLAQRRRQGATAAPSLSAAEATARSEPYYPGQAVRDLLVTTGVLALLLGYVLLRHGAELHAPADPAIEFIARPEWYFLPLFQLRHYFKGDLEFIATTVLPGLAVGFLAALPFLEPWLSRRTARAHSLLLAAVGLGAVTTLALGVMAELEDRNNPSYPRVVANSARLSEQAQRLAALGVPLAGPTELYKNDPVLWGEKVYRAQCATCHHPCASNPYKGDPCLEGYATRTWLTKFFKDPANRYFFGNSKIDEMEPWTGADSDLKAVVEFVYAQGQRPDADAVLAERGRRLFDSEGCGSCHSLDGQGTGEAPDLKGYATVGWLSAFIRDGSAPRFYGKLNKMDAFPHEKLDGDQLQAVISYLRAQTDAQARFPGD